MSKQTVFTANFLFGLGILSALSASATSALPRPPQYVLMAFDGSKTMSAWDETREFARNSTATGAPVKFTYFVSGVYFLGEKNKILYHSPQHGVGKSDIGFGSTQADISARIDEINAAFKEGNEIGTHLNGHYDSSTWTAADWLSDFTQFFQLFLGVFKNNEIKKDWAFEEKDIVGFRAPLLATSSGLWSTLPSQHILYDTSKIAEPNYWPEKNRYQTWNFPLARFHIVAGKTSTSYNRWTLSMDYNFYESQSKAVEDPAHAKMYEQEMLDTYLKYFHDNYYGNRAPLNIGHHFSHFNNGAYWRAMKTFARSVCGKPEVKCVTYTEYMNYLNSLTPEMIATYQKNDFEHLPGTPITTLPANKRSTMRMTEDGVSAYLPSATDGPEMIADPVGAHEAE